MSPTSSVSPAPMDQYAAPGRRAVTRLGLWLAAGTGHLATLTALGGLLVALAYAIGGWGITALSVNVTGQGFSWLRSDSWAVALLQTGNITLDLLGLAIALYTAYGIAGPAGRDPRLRQWPGRDDHGDRLPGWSGRRRDRRRHHPGTPADHRPGQMATSHG
ncbi:hypothetical protein OG250_42005 [Streptomyces sp. NBC_00487]|uniref:hypothetical protein n=1 Tax=unclassified Streptomyces TaxID=2593676 RepID=UPI002E197E92|nr:MULTISPECIES: hypothetical protein [unclassified Streptomyces]